MSNPEDSLPKELSFEEAMDVLDDELRAAMSELYERTGDVIDPEKETMIDHTWVMQLNVLLAKLIAIDRFESDEKRAIVGYRAMMFGLQIVDYISDVREFHITEFAGLGGETAKEVVARIEEMAQSYLHSRPVLKQFVEAYAPIVDRSGDYTDYVMTIIAVTIRLAERQLAIESRMHRLQPITHGKGEYHSNYEAPAYTIVGKQAVGLTVVTYAVVDGSWEEFVFPRNVTSGALHGPQL